MYAVIVGKHNLFPPKVVDNSYKFRDTGLLFSELRLTSFRGSSRPDCAERGIRGILNVVLFNIEQQRFSLERLWELGASQDLIKFYQDWSPDINGPQSHKAGQAWFNFLACRGEFLYFLYRLLLMLRRRNLVPIFF